MLPPYKMLFPNHLQKSPPCLLKEIPVGQSLHYQFLNAVYSFDYEHMWQSIAGGVKIKLFNIV